MKLNYSNQISLSKIFRFFVWSAFRWPFSVFNVQSLRSLTIFLFISFTQLARNFISFSHFISFLFPFQVFESLLNRFVSRIELSCFPFDLCRRMQDSVSVLIICVSEMSIVCDFSIRKCRLNSTRCKKFKNLKLNGNFFLRHQCNCNPGCIELKLEKVIKFLFLLPPRKIF